MVFGCKFSSSQMMSLCPQFPHSVNLSWPRIRPAGGTVATLHNGQTIPITGGWVTGANSTFTGKAIRRSLIAWFDGRPRLTGVARRFSGRSMTIPS
jgi:hypothetical protein